VTVTDEGPQSGRTGGVHPRITVVRTSGAQRGALLSSLAVPQAGTLDLDQRPVVLAPADVTAIATALAADRAGERRAALRRLEQELRHALEVRDQATAERDGLSGQHQRLSDARTWCEDLSRRSGELAEAVTRAGEEADRRRADHRAASERLDRVLEQRAAAAAAIEDADRELADLEGAQLDETGLRREAEAANGAVQVAARAVGAAQAELARLEERRAEVVAASEAAVDARSRVDTALETPVVDDTRVRDALQAIEGAAASHIGDLSAPGPELAEEISAAQAALDRALAAAGPLPNPDALARAEAEVQAAQQALLDLDEAGRTGSLSPEARAEIDAIHDAVLQAEDRAERGVGRNAARRRLEQLRAEEQELLAKHGYDSHLDVVLSGGRPGGGGIRLAVEQRVQSAREHLETARLAARGTDEVIAARAALDELVTRGTELVAVDPADRLLDLLDAHPAAPHELVTELADALAAVGVRPVATPLVHAATTWLAEQGELHGARRRGRDQVADLDAEIVRCTDALEQLTRDIEAATANCERSGRELDAARRRVANLEAELSARAGEDARRLQRMAAAEQLRSQVDAVSATLVRAEAEARAGVEALAASVQAAELAWDRAEAEITDASRRVRRIAEDHLEGRIPELDPDPVVAAAQLVPSLEDAADRLARAVEAAEAAVTAATTEAESVAAQVADLRGATTGPSDADGRDAVVRAVTREAPGSVVVIDDSVLAVAGGASDDLLDRLVDASTERSIVVLSDDHQVLGWAINLPEEHGVLAPSSLAEALLTDRPTGTGVPATAFDVHLDPHLDPRAAGRPGSVRG
jgi:hypothetical protein